MIRKLALLVLLVTLNSYAMEPFGKYVCNVYATPDKFIATVNPNIPLKEGVRLLGSLAVGMIDGEFVEFATFPFSAEVQQFAQEYYPHNVTGNELRAEMLPDQSGIKFTFKTYTDTPVMSELNSYHSFRDNKTFMKPHWTRMSGFMASINTSVTYSCFLTN